MHERTVCTAVSRSNRDCDGPIPPGAPVSLCWKHLIRAYMFVRDGLDEPTHLSSESHERGKHEPQFVYYVRFGDRVKIGTSSHVARRMESVPHDEVLAVERGGVELERERHNQFARYHIKGEWFTADPELLAHAYRVSLAYPDLALR